MFSKFESRVVGRGTLLSLSPVRVGAGRDREIGGPDYSVVKDASGRPFIPGTTIRGALRSFAEKFLKSQGESAQGCEHGSCKVDRSPCMVCSLFGSRHFASPLSVFDAHPVNWYGQLELRNGLPVNRDSGRSDHMTPWEIEVVSAGTRFELAVELSNGTPWMCGLTAVMFSAMEREMIPLGAGHARGLGSVTLKDYSFSVIATPQELLEYLDGGAVNDGKPVNSELRGEWSSALKQKLKEATNVQTAG